MKILNVIKEFFLKRFHKDEEVKLLNEVNEKQEKYQFVEDIELKDDYMEEDTYKFMENMGATQEVFQQIENIDEVNIENLKDLKKIFKFFDYSKLEINKILFENIDIIYEDANLINSNIKFYDINFNNQFILKQLLYSYPLLFTNVDKAKELISIFNKYQIQPYYQAFIMYKNHYIFKCGKEKLIESLNIIKNITKREETFINVVTSIPEIIGQVEYKDILNLINS